MKPTRLLTTLAAAAALALPAARADENFFGYSYGAETLPKGRWEVYNWATGRFGKGTGKYAAFDFKQELEYGVTDRFQMSLYVNERYHDYSGGAVEAESADARGARLHRFAYEGNQLSFKYNLLSPFKDAFGLALYVEPGYSQIDKISGEKVLEWELETKLILQKDFLDDQLITVLNLTSEFEWHRPRPAGGESYDGEMVWEATGGICYRVAPHWFVGVEARYHTEFPNMDLHNQESRAFLAGPAVHYGGERWWATLTWLPQITGSPHTERSDRLDLAEHERHEIRLKVGYNF